MLKLAPILEEVPEDICMSGYEGSGGHDRKLHQALPFHIGGGIGPESITRKSEMANHNSRVRDMATNQTFGQRIRELRKAKNLTQRELAERVASRLRKEDRRGFDVTYLTGFSVPWL